MAITVSTKPLSNKSARDNFVSKDTFTRLEHPVGDSGKLVTRWQIKVRNSSKTNFDFNISRDGVVTPKLGTIIGSTRNSVRIQLDRTKLYLVRIKPDNQRWSTWNEIDLSGILRIVGPRHIDRYATKFTANGGSVTNRRPGHEAKNTSKGKEVNHLYVNSNAPRLLNSFRLIENDFDPYTGNNISPPGRNLKGSKLNPTDADKFFTP